MNVTEAISDALKRYTDCRYVIPGYPITEIGPMTGAEMVINEKTGLEYALGDSLAGRRAALIIKNVGVNACVDPLLQATAQGIIGGVVLVVGDDPDAIGSQTSQDTRVIGELAEIPVIEPWAGCVHVAVEAALEASEEFSRPAMLRVTPRLLSQEALFAPVPRRDGQGRLSDRSWTMYGRVTASRALFRALQAWSDASPMNIWAGEPAAVGPEEGPTRVVTVYPPPSRITTYSDIREDSLPFVKNHAGRILLQASVPGEAPQTLAERGYSRTFCKDCPFATLVSLMKERGLRPVCDAGCMVLAMTPPYEIGVASYGMGASIAVAARSTGIALTGDYALLHSGINALMDVYEKGLPLLCIIVQNFCAAMTGKQQAYPVERYLGWANPEVVRIENTGRLRELLGSRDLPAVIIVQGECPEGQDHETIRY